MPNLRLLLLLSCVGLSPSCIEVPPLEDPPDEQEPKPDPVADFTFTATPVQEQVLPGGTLDCTIQRTWVGAAGGSTTWSLVSPPTGIELQPFSLAPGETRGTLSLRVGAGTTPGAYTLTLQGKSGSVTKQATVTVTVGKPGDLVVNWVVPTPGKAYTKGPLLLQFTVEGGAAEQVEILKDSTVLVKPTGTPYAFTWDTTQEAEGSYQLSIRATRGGAVFTSAPRTVIVDRTAPTVTSYLPARNAATVGVHESIQLVFSEPMNPQSVAEESVGLKAGTGEAIPKSVALSADGKTLTVKPLNPLVAPSTVQVDFAATGNTLTDLAGNTLVNSPTWGFTVPTWLPLGGAISAVGGATPAENVVLKLNHDNQPVIAWAESDGSSKNIYVSAWTGQVWTQLGSPLSGLAAVGTNAETPTLVIDETGAPIVAWDETTGNGDGRTIFVRRWTGSTWESMSSPTPPSPDPDYPSAPKLTFGGGSLNLITDFFASGHLTVESYQYIKPTSAWQRRSPPSHPSLFNPSGSSATGAGSDIYLAATVYDERKSARSVAVYKNDDGHLGGITLGSGAATPSIDADINGRPWVAWVGTTTSPQSDGQIYWARWEGSAWSTAQGVDTRASGNTWPSLALAKGGPHVLAWSGIIDSERSIVVSQWVGNSWQPIGAPLNALATAGTPANRPSVGMDSSAQPFIAWSEADANTANIYVVRINR
jgi:hypothetical protein